MKIKPFSEVAKRDWPMENKYLVKVFLSSQFLVQEYHEDGIVRLSICQTKRKGTKWADGITWDQLQEIKNLVGYHDKCAVEVYPERTKVVNVANMRHLFALPVRPEFAW